MSKSNIDSIPAPLLNVDNHKLEIIKKSCKGVVAMNFQEMLIDLNFIALPSIQITITNFTLAFS